MKKMTTLTALLCVPMSVLAGDVFTASPAALPADLGTPSTRSRAVTPDLAALEVAGVGEALTFSVFDDLSFEGVIASVSTDHGFRVISGTLPGEAEGEFLIVAGRGVMDAEVRTARAGSYAVRPLPGGGHAALRINADGFAPCATDHEHGVGEAGATPPSYEPRGIATIRVMVVYTAQARDAQGGEAAIQARAVFAISQSNLVYTTSGIQAALVLAYTGLVNYTESNNASTDLSRLRNTSDGLIDEVHCIRDAVGADMCAMLVNSFNACGIAYVMRDVSPDFRTSAFSVTDKDCINGYTFPHELGHNLGCAHDRANAGGTPYAYPYAYGYRTPDEVYRSVMSYAPGARIGRFSSANIIYDGYAMGIPIGQAGETDNAQCITNTAPTAAVWRGPAQTSADFNEDGNVDQDDVGCLIHMAAGGTGCSGLDPDFNQDGNVDQDDVAELINLVAGGGGCP